MSKFSTIAASVAVIGGMVVSAVSVEAALNLPKQNCSYSFNTNMKLGSRGVDVMNLQKVLNMYPQTQVSVSGAGSPGMETSTFGPATRAAANKFQALHLAELGISAPTGNVFAGTRALLNQVCNGTVSTTPGNTNPGTTSTGPITAMLAASQPTGMIVQGQSGALLANIAFSGNGTVTSVKLQRTGVSADATLTNVYLYDGNVRISDAASVVTGGYINFNASNGLFTVNGSRIISVRADILSTANGQSVGVQLNSVTAGGAVSTFTGVSGNQLTIANVAIAAVNFASLNQSALAPDAGVTQYNIWSGSATVSTRAVNMKAASFKFVGSAPVDSLQNINLYVDGAKVAGPVTVNAANNNKVSFDFGATPLNLTTGSHTIDLRADIVKGSYRTITMSVENVADLMFEDTNLAGVNVSATIGNATFTQSLATYGVITVNRGSVTVNVDPSFTATKVTGGATNVPVGQFTLRGYGEDVKVNTLKVTFATTTISTLNNVALYVNGGQVGSSANFTVAAASAGGITYTLGSSLIIPAGTTVTLTVKADIVDTNSTAYTTGTIAAVIGGVSSNAQGQSSYELISVAGSAITGNVLTITSGAGAFARTSGFTARTVAPNSSNVQIGSFTLQANSAEAIKVNSVGVKMNVAGDSVTTVGGNSISNYSNLTLKSGSTVLGTPVGNPQAGTSTFSFTDIVIPANGTQTFDVYADIGGTATTTGAGSTQPSVTADMAVTSRGSISNTSTVSSVTGVAITSTASTLAATTLQSSSPVAQFVVGGSTFGIATFKVSTAAAGTSATVREMRFATTGTDAVTTITVGGVTSTVIGSGATATTTVSGLSIPVTFSGTDIPVTVKFAGFQGTTSNGSLTTSVASVAITLSYVEAVSGSGTVISSSTQVPSNTMKLVASKPTITVGAGNTDTLVLSAENKVGEFTVTADANGKISVASSALTLSGVGITNVEFSAPRIADGNTTITSATVAGSSTVGINFNPQYEIGAGQSKTFSVFAMVKGAAQTSFSPYVTSNFASSTSFVWMDVIGGNTQQTGASIYNFPTSSFTTKR